MMRTRLTTLAALVAAAVGLSACETEEPETVEQQPLPEGTVFELFVVNEDPDAAFSIVFVPDEAYGDMNIPANRKAFIEHATGLIENGYWQNQSYFNGLFKFNYYFMSVPGSIVERTPDEDGNFRCPTVTWPDEALTDAAFADQMILIHTKSLRDCGGGSVRATVEPTAHRAIVHETGHALFGLPDEYCCDGFYVESPPILYRTRRACRRDKDNEAWRDCVSFVSSRDGRTYWRSQGNITSNLITRNGGDTVWESGPADWFVIKEAYEALGRPGVADPNVLAPGYWNYRIRQR